MNSLKRISLKRTSTKRLAGIGLSTFGLVLGFLCLGRAVETALDTDPDRLDKRETVLAGMLLGIPATVGAVWMMGTMERDRKLAYSHRLQALFYKALQANNGRINAIQFAMLAEVSLKEAQQCLDTWAGPMNADFDIDEAGVIVYCFNV
ncbi:MAG: hypothetical protein AAFO84_03350 [Cyanobacteria bacterium J06598_1]